MVLHLSFPSLEGEGYLFLFEEENLIAQTPKLCKLFGLPIKFDQIIRIENIFAINLIFCTKRLASLYN